MPALETGFDRNEIDFCLREGLVYGGNELLEIIQDGRSILPLGNVIVTGVEEDLLRSIGNHNSIGKIAPLPPNGPRLRSNRASCSTSF